MPTCRNARLAGRGHRLPSHAHPAVARRAGKHHRRPFHQASRPGAGGTQRRSGRHRYPRAGRDALVRARHHHAGRAAVARSASSARHFALVVDEYGALQGLVTLEDILEEIFGSIPDEHAVERRPDMRPHADGSYLVDGTVPVRDLNRELDWNLPDEDATTVAGLVIHEAGTIPEVGQRFAFFGYTFEILRRQRNQITALRITPPVQGSLLRLARGQRRKRQGMDGAGHLVLAARHRPGAGAPRATAPRRPRKPAGPKMGFARCRPRGPGVAGMAGAFVPHVQRQRREAPGSVSPGWCRQQSWGELLRAPGESQAIRFLVFFTLRSHNPDMVNRAPRVSKRTSGSSRKTSACANRKRRMCAAPDCTSRAIAGSPSRART